MGASRRRRALESQSELLLLRIVRDHRVLSSVCGGSMVLRHSFVVAAGRRRGNRGIAVSSRDVRFVYGAAMPCTVYVFFRPCRRGAGCAVGPDRRWIAFLHYRGGGFAHSEADAYS